MFRSPSLALALAFAALAALPAFASAAEIKVNTTADQPPSQPECAGAANDCSLRQAIDLANNHSPGGDTIVLPAGHYLLTIQGSEEDEGKTGDLDIAIGSEIAIRGAGARTTTVDATGLGDRVFDVLEHGSLTLSGLTVTGGTGINLNGGGIRAEIATLNLEAVAVRGNVATREGSGGGVYVDETVLSIASSLLAENHNSGDGGGLYTEDSQVTLVNTTIANNVVNTALYPENPGWGAFGGGAELNDGSLFMQNVTVAGNLIQDANGGASGTGAGLLADPETGEALNTIVAGNSGINVEKTGQCDGPILSGGHNLEGSLPPGEERCFTGPTDLIADPLLGPLADNGGETDTMAIPLGSPAFNTADPARCPATDQRGYPRPQLGGCDIGAFEYTPPPPTIKRKGKVHVKASGKTFLVKPGFKVTCPPEGSACTATMKASWKGSIGKKAFKVAPGKTKALNLKLNGRGAKQLKRRGKLKAKFEVSCPAASGAIVTATAKLMLKLPPARHKRAG
jgi:hypothetical protein